MRVHITALIVALSLGSASTVSFAQTQSLADLSKKEEERRKSVKAPGKVYTNKELGSAPATAPAAPPAAEAKPAAAADAPKDAATAAKPEPAEPPKDQAYWSGRMKELQTQLDRDQTYLEALQSRINALSTDFVNRDDPAQRAKISADRQRAIAEQERLKQQIANGTKAIADLQEEARRAGVPPGWLR
jgi:hypothetical protein